MNTKSILEITPVLIFSIVLSIWYVDFPLAIWIDNYLVIHKRIPKIPDLLLLIILVLSFLSWLAYYYFAKRGFRSKHTYFFMVTGTVLPLSYAAKEILQLLFGRMQTRRFLLDPNFTGSYWFNWGDGYRGFPSGHMLVFTALLLTLCNLYPRYKLIYAVTLFVLGFALVATDYHFLSDIIAGAYIGAIIFYFIFQAFENRRNN